MRDLLRHSLAMLRDFRLVGLHLILNAALLVSASFWLLIPEEHVWQLIFAALSAVLIIVVFLWLHSATLVYGANPIRSEFRGAFALRLARMFWLLIGCIALFWCMRVVDGWMDHRWQIAGYLYSKAPSSLRPIGGENGYVNLVEYAFSILLWYVLPLALLPIVAARVVGARVRDGLRALSHWRYWVAMAITSAVGVWLTSLILEWIPGKTLRQQTTSLVLRLAVVYALATAAWLVTAGLLGYFVARGGDSSADVAGKAAA
ncbi:MAG TPA: hypothetical protein VMH04_18270 [Candidatus Solibacter sp.]|nr:hypothetical protein [Candidatus Solibacter sp.]